MANLSFKRKWFCDVHLWPIQGHGWCLCSLVSRPKNIKHHSSLAAGWGLFWALTINLQSLFSLLGTLPAFLLILLTCLKLFAIAPWMKSVRFKKPTTVVITGLVVAWRTQIFIVDPWLRKAVTLGHSKAGRPQNLSADRLSYLRPWKKLESSKIRTK